MTVPSLCLPSTTVCPQPLFALNHCLPSTTVCPQLTVEDDLFSRDGESFGLLLQANFGTGQIRRAKKDGDIQRKALRQQKFLSGKPVVGGTQTMTKGGMATSLSFTPVQGLELANPALEREKKRKLEEINKSYFSACLN